MIHESPEQAQTFVTNLGIANEPQKVEEPIGALVPPLDDLAGCLSRKLLFLIGRESESHPSGRGNLRDVRLN